MHYFDDHSRNFLFSCKLSNWNLTLHLLLLHFVPWGVYILAWRKISYQKIMLWLQPTQLLHSILIRTHYYSCYDIARNLNHQIVQLLNKKKNRWLKEFIFHASFGDKFMVRCSIWYYLHNLRNVKNTHGRVLILRKLQASSLQLY